MINVEDQKENFKSIVKKYIHRDGIESLMNWLDTTDFYTAPSSAKYHGAFEGGLCAHSIQVFNCLVEKMDKESDNMETIAIVSLFHDLCKTNFYKVSMRNTKDESGKWIQVPYYEYSDYSLPLGHGEKSMYLLMKHISLTDEEALAIRWHMSGWYSNNPGEQQALSSAMHYSKLVLKLQQADSEAAFFYNL